jgi:hypothetical protein
MQKMVALLLCAAAFAGALRAQECKAKFAVGFTDGKGVQSGLTTEQRKYWEKEGVKKFKGMCLDFAKPEYLILWSVGLSGKELAESGVGNFNRARETGEATTMVNPTTSDKMSTTDSRCRKRAGGEGERAGSVIDNSGSDGSAGECLEVVEEGEKDLGVWKGLFGQGYGRESGRFPALFACV